MRDNSTLKKEKAYSYRKQGYSIKEIAQELHIAQSTASLWCKNIPLDENAVKRLEKRKKEGVQKSILTRKETKELLKKEIERKVIKELSTISIDPSLQKLLCSLFFWTEGGKHTDAFVYFTNSDPVMVATFLHLLRSSFSIEEKKLRVLVHIHEYHNKEEILKFWSKTTNIPLSQFSKSYLKPHTKKRIREDYKGSLRIRYYDAKVALELRTFYNTFAQNLGVSFSGRT